MNQIGLVLALFIGGCLYAPPSISTLPQRRQYLAPQIADWLNATMKCPSANLTFVSSDTRGMPSFPQYFDFYVAEGCGQRTDFVTVVKMLGANVVEQQASPVPPLEQYRAEAHAQTAKTAAFDFGCTDLSYVDLSERLATLRDTYDASIGAAGCGKRATYHTHCNQIGYSAGANQIACNSKQDLTTASY